MELSISVEIHSLSLNTSLASRFPEDPHEQKNNAAAVRRTAARAKKSPLLLIHKDLLHGFKVPVAIEIIRFEITGLGPLVPTVDSD